MITSVRITERAGDSCGRHEALVEATSPTQKAETPSSNNVGARTPPANRLADLRHGFGFVCFDGIGWTMQNEKLAPNFIGG